MFPSTNKLTLVAVIVIFVTNIINAGVSTASAGVAMIELLSFGVHRYVSLGLAILLAVFVFLYITYNYKIHDFIKNQGADNNE